MTDQDLAGAEGVSVRASGRRVGDPLPGRRLYQLAQHDYKPKAGADGQRGNAAATRTPPPRQVLRVSRPIRI